MSYDPDSEILNGLNCCSCENKDSRLNCPWYAKRLGQKGGSICASYRPSSIFVMRLAEKYTSAPDTMSVTEKLLFEQATSIVNTVMGEKKGQEESDS